MSTAAYLIDTAGATPTAASVLRLPLPELLPARRGDCAVAVGTALAGVDLLAAFTEPAARAELRTRLTPSDGPAPAGPPSSHAQAEQQEHDRYFQVGRTGGDAAAGFVAGLVLAHLSAHENCLRMGLTVVAEPDWDLLFGGLRALLRHARDEAAGAGRAAAEGTAVGGRAVGGRAVGVAAVEGLIGAGPGALPAWPSPAGWRDGYDPTRRWLVGHQLFFTLIQGAVVGLNCFATAVAEQEIGAAEQGLALAAAFLRSSAAAMRFASDFAPADYDRTVRPAMAPPKVRAGFSGLQTRDHAYLVRTFGAVKPLLVAVAGQVRAHEEFVESVVSAYAAHEFICARFRGDVLPSLRMAAASRGSTGRAGVEVIREMMRARLALVGPAPTAPNEPATESGR